MSTLKLLQEQHNHPAIKFAGLHYSQPGNQATDAHFTQYFQIHFQHIHENIRDSQNEVKQLQQHVADLNIKLDQLSALLAYLAPQQNSNQAGH
jgi:hypothetical protein